MQLAAMLAARTAAAGARVAQRRRPRATVLIVDRAANALTPLLLIQNGPLHRHHPSGLHATPPADELWQDEEEVIQSRCVQCIALLLRRRDALEAMLARTHAVTCLVAAIDCTAIYVY